MKPDFEKSFGDFIDRREYDEAANALFGMVRTSFQAGWLAAGGNPPKPQKVLEILRPQRVIPIENHPESTNTDMQPDNYSDE